MPEGDNDGRGLDTDDDVGPEGGECIEEDLLVGRNFRLADDLAGTVEGPIPEKRPHDGTWDKVILV